MSFFDDESYQLSASFSMPCQASNRKDASSIITIFLS